MRLEIASHKAAKYSCLNFHYAKVLPAHYLGFSVFNNNNEWCGCILFGGGAGAYMGSPYGLNYGQYLELNRMALNNCVSVVKLQGFQAWQTNWLSFKSL